MSFFRNSFSFTVFLTEISFFFKILKDDCFKLLKIFRTLYKVKDLLIMLIYKFNKTFKIITILRNIILSYSYKLFFRY